MTSGHVTNEELNLLLDGRTDANDRDVIHTHLEECPRCRAAFQSLENLNALMRTQRVVRVSDGFTHKVLASLNISQRTWLYGIVENLAAIFALMIVVGLMVSVFVATGVIGTQELQQTQTTVRSISNYVGGWSESFAAAINGALHKYFPFLYNAGTAKLLLLLASSFVLLMIFDKFLKGRVSAGQRG